MIPVNSPATTYTPELITGFINGKPVVRTKAAGSGAAMTTAGNLPDNVTSGMSVFIVAAQVIAGAGATNDTDGAFFGSGAAVGLTRNSFNNKIVAQMRPSTFIAPTDAIVNGTFYTYRLIYNGSSQYVSINNATPTTAAIGAGTTTPGTFNVFNFPGNGGLGNKQIAEIIIVTRDLNSAEITQVETYLKTKYAHY